MVFYILMVSLGLIKLLIACLFFASCSSSEIARINTNVNNLLTHKVDAGDYWQTPKETRLLKSGDCEDYAILKWSELINSGYDESIIYFALVNINGNYDNHLLLKINGIYYDNTNWNRWYYDGDFTLLELFNRYELPKDEYTKNNFLSMLERHNAINK